MSTNNSLQLGWDLTEPKTALASFLGTLPTPPQLLALGEPTHGVEALPTWRNRLFQILVEDHGFRSIALESDIIAGQVVNAYITSGQGHLDTVMAQGFSHGFGAFLANRALVEWTEHFNTGRDPADKVHFYGFDAPLENLWAASPRLCLLALHAFLSRHLKAALVDAATLERLCGEDARWTTPAAAMDPAASFGDSGEAQQLRVLADDLAHLLRLETPHLAAQEEYWEAHLHARTATGLLRYHAVVAGSAPDRTAQMLSERDLMMADNLSAIAEREQARGPTFVFAHNSHLRRPLSAMKMRGMTLEWWSAGAHLSARLGQRYAFIEGDLGVAPGRGIGQAALDTLAGMLTTQAHPATLFATRALAAALPSDLTTRTDLPPGAGYFPLERQDLSLTDGVLFVREPTS